ncbi:MAG: CNNM domain-containing protein [Bacteroidales bacterium]
MALLLFYLFLSLFVSFMCSIMESVLLSTNESFLIVKKKEGKTWAIIFLLLKENVDKSLSAILSLNTIAHTVGAAGVGAQAVKVFGEAYFGVVSAVLTILILIITEIIPKTIGTQYWKKLGFVTAYIIRGMIFITYPLVILAGFITKKILKQDQCETVSRDEITAMATISAQEGGITENEYHILQNILKLKNVRVNDIMTPRVVMVVADEQLSLDEFLQNKSYLRFSRIPVYVESEEHINGYVFRQTVFEKLAEGAHDLCLKDIIRPIIIVPDSMRLFNMWKKLLEEKEHIALVVDEYGGVDGLVTLEDIIESLLGLEIMDEKDEIPDMRKYARDKWKARQIKYDFIEKMKNSHKDKTSDT